MTDNKNNVDFWTLGALVLWVTLFLAGMFPEIVFTSLREAGYVATMRALVNSHWFITFACTAFLGWFTFCRCVECGDQTDIALGKSVQIIILAMTAFLPMSIERALDYYYYIPDPFYRYLILSVLAVKVLTWLYLVIMILRYYLVSGHKVYRRIPLVFPSALLPQEEDGPPAVPDTEKAE